MNASTTTTTIRLGAGTASNVHPYDAALRAAEAEREAELREAEAEARHAAAERAAFDRSVRRRAAPLVAVGGGYAFPSRPRR